MRAPRSTSGSLAALLLAGLAAVLSGLLLFVGPASAANSLESSTPTADAELGSSPTQLQLTFVEPIGDGVSPDDIGLALTCGGAPIGIGPRQVGTDGRTVIAPITQIAPVGTCNVSWRLPDDSTGTFSFKILASETSAPEEPTDETTTETTQPAALVDVEPTEPPKVSGFLGISRLLTYMSLGALFGALVIIALAWPEGVEYVLTLRFVRSAWLLALAGSIAVVVFTTADVRNQSVGSSITPTAWFDLLDDNVGRGIILRLALVAAAGWVALRPERVTDPGTQMISLAVPALALATYGFSRTGGDLTIIGYAAGGLHAVAMGVWFGGLALLSRVVLTGPGDEDLVHAVRGFGRLATPALLVTVATGTIQVYRLDAGGLFSSRHGQLMLLKALAVGAMAYLGTLSRHLINQRLARADHLELRVASRLRRAISVELLIGVVVLSLTAAMLASQPPNLSVASPASAYRFDRTLTDGDFSVRIGLNPAQVGANGVRVELLSPESISGFTVRLLPQQAPDVVGWEIRVPLTEPGAATLDPRVGLSLDGPGVWNIEITGNTSDGELPTLITALVVPDPAGPATSVPVTLNPPATLPPVTAPPAETTIPEEEAAPDETTAPDEDGG